MTLPWPARPSAWAAASSCGSGVRSYSASSRSACAASGVAYLTAGIGPGAFMRLLSTVSRSHASHQGGVLVEHRQDLLARLGRQHPHHAVDAGVAVALERVRLARRGEDVER